MVAKTIIKNWLERADKTHTHMLVIHDGLLHDDYPVFVDQDKNLKEVIAGYKKHSRMQKIIELYSLKGLS